MVDWDGVCGGASDDGSYDCEDSGWSPGMYEGEQGESTKHNSPKNRIIGDFTDSQKALFLFLSTQGYGWSRFAMSVRRQGWCSKRQEDTMLSMAEKICIHRFGSNDDWKLRVFGKDVKK